MKVYFYVKTNIILVGDVVGVVVGVVVYVVVGVVVGGVVVTHLTTVVFVPGEVRRMTGLPSVL